MRHVCILVGNININGDTSPSGSFLWGVFDIRNVRYRNNFAESSID